VARKGQYKLVYYYYYSGRRIQEKKREGKEWIGAERRRETALWKRRLFLQILKTGKPKESENETGKERKKEDRSRRNYRRPEKRIKIQE